MNSTQHNDEDIAVVQSKDGKVVALAFNMCRMCYIPFRMNFWNMYRVSSISSRLVSYMC